MSDPLTILLGGVALGVGLIAIAVWAGIKGATYP